MRVLCKILVLILAGILCSCTKSLDQDCTSCIGIYIGEVLHCSRSFFELLSNPSAHDGEAVRIIGYIVHDDGDSYLGFRSESIGEFPIRSELLKIEFKSNDEHYRNFNKQRVEVFGEYRVGSESPLVAYSIVNVSKVSLY